MGTRHLIAVVKDKEYKLAQYGQWDGYPSGQGVDILQFLREKEISIFNKQMDNVKFITDEKQKEISEFLKSIGCGPDGWMDMIQSKKYQKKYFSLSRDCSSKILEIIYNSKDTVWVHNQLDFAQDSLFCEWGYVIDLDKNTFEIYRGFNTKSLNEFDRFYFLTNVVEGKYFPIKLVKEYDLNNLPTEDEFIEFFNKLDEEEEAEYQKLTKKD